MTATRLDISRHRERFNLDRFVEAGHTISVIGAGALGSPLISYVAKLGVPRIEVFDDDVVGSHNIPNQHFGIGDVRRKKVDAIAAIVERDTGLKIVTHDTRFTGAQQLGSIVLCCVDDMDVRRLVFESCKLKHWVSVLIEGRIGTKGGRVYCIDPCNPRHIRRYDTKEVLYPQREAPRLGACQTEQSVGPIATMFASIMGTQLMNWFAVSCGGEDNLDHEIILNTDPFDILAQRFD